MPQFELKIHQLPAVQLQTIDGVERREYIRSDEPRDVSTVDTILLHTMFNPLVEREEQFAATACLNLLLSYGVSAHYIIDRMGVVFQCVPLEYMAWHAGKSKMPAPDNRERVNLFSTGIELIASETSGITDEQYTAVAALILQLMSELPVQHVLGHADVAGARVRAGEQAGEAKTDPWKLDWERLRALLTPEIGAVRARKLFQLREE